MKKIGLCSINAEFTRDYAQKHNKNYIVFGEMMFDFIKENIASIKNPKHAKDIFLPAIRHIKPIAHDTLLLDMEVLMHDEAVEELKKNYKLVYLKNAVPKASLEKIMVDDYTARLKKICDEEVV
jgi:hypothetical protein